MQLRKPPATAGASTAPVRRAVHWTNRQKLLSSGLSIFEPYLSLITFGSKNGGLLAEFSNTIVEADEEAQQTDFAGETIPIASKNHVPLLAKPPPITST